MAGMNGNIIPKKNAKGSMDSEKMEGDSSERGKRNKIITRSQNDNLKVWAKFGGGG